MKQFYTDSQFNLDDVFAVSQEYVDNFIQLNESHGVHCTRQFAENTYTDGKLLPAQIKTMADFMQRREDCVNYSAADGDVAEFMSNVYHEGYQGYFRYHYNTPSRASGCNSGGWFEDLNKPILRAVANKCNLPNLIIGTKTSKGEDHDNFLGVSKENIYIGQECKLQADNTSLPKALKSMLMNKNAGTSLMGTIVFATTKVFKEKKGVSAITALVNLWHMSESDAAKVVNIIIETGDQGGAFEIDEYLSVLVLGENVQEYKTYLPYINKKNGKVGKHVMQNHGGSNGWTLHNSAINNIVEFLSKKLDNALQNKGT